MLELKNFHSSLSICEAYEKDLYIMETPGGLQEVTIISESALYKLICKSRKAEAKVFQRWVFEEILPTIRRTGRYDMSSITKPSSDLSIRERTVAVEKMELENMNTKTALLEKTSALLEKLGCFDDRAKTLVQSSALNIMAGSVTPSMPLQITSGDVECSISKRIRDRFSATADARTLQTIGRQMAKKYQEIHGAKPPKRTEYVGGTLRDVNHYVISDWTEFGDAILDTYF